MTVDHQRNPVGAAFDNADGIKALGVNLLAHGLDAMAREPGKNKITEGFFRTGRTWNIDEIFGERGQLVTINALDDFGLFPFAYHRSYALHLLKCHAPARLLIFVKLPAREAG